MKGVIVYDTKYCTTLKAAKQLNQELGFCDLYSVDQFSLNGTSYDYVVLGCYVYDNTMSYNMQRFVSTYESYLKTRRVYAYVMMLEGDVAEKYLQPMIKQIGPAIKFMQSFGGRLEIDCLEPLDYAQIKKQLQQLKLPFRDINIYDKTAVQAFGERVMADLTKERKLQVELSMLGQLNRILKQQETGMMSGMVDEKLMILPCQYIYENPSVYITECTLEVNVSSEPITVLIQTEKQQDLILLRGRLYEEPMTPDHPVRLCMKDVRYQHAYKQLLSLDIIMKLEVKEMEWHTTRYHPKKLRQTYYFYPES